MATKKSALDMEWWQFQKKEQKFLANRDLFEILLNLLIHTVSNYS